MILCVGPISEAERVLDFELVCGYGLKYRKKNNTQGGDKSCWISCSLRQTSGVLERPRCMLGYLGEKNSRHLVYVELCTE